MKLKLWILSCHCRSASIGAFSNFRGIARSPIAAMLAISEDPEEVLENGLQVYNLLKKEF